VGIVVGTLSSAGYLSVIKRLRSIISAAGKKSYTFVMGKPNPAKLANFPECEVFVLVACPQTALLDSKEYLSPVITPFEAELAFSQKRAWTGEYRLDFSGLAGDQGLEAGNGGVQEVDSEDEEEEPRFSLISGAYESGSVVRGSQEGETSSAVALVSNDVRALQVSEGARALTTFGGRKHEGGAKSGAEYLVSKRTYQGLSVPQYMRQENGTQAGGSEKSTPVVTVVKGRSGRAAGYSDEK
jgi:diphthamide biosynthesis protein 2